jgi:hypothetical protein
LADKEMSQRVCSFRPQEGGRKLYIGFPGFLLLVHFKPAGLAQLQIGASGNMPGIGTDPGVAEKRLPRADLRSPFGTKKGAPKNCRRIQIGRVAPLQNAALQARFGFGKSLPSSTAGLQDNRMVCYIADSI